MLGFTLGVTHYVCVLSHFSHVRFFAILYTTALQAPVHGLL